MHLWRSALLASVFAIAAVLAAASAGAVQSKIKWLSGSEILRQFNDATIDGRYKSGRAFTERYAADGRLTYQERDVTLNGHWSVTAGTLCTIYAADTSGGCYRVAQVDANCFEFYFVSRTEAAAPGPENGEPAWTARGALQGQASACRDEPSV